MAQRILRYKGNDISVSYDLKKCIHAAECIHGLPPAFDPKRKPWVDPDAADADAIAKTIHRCPSGALQYERHDGGGAEPVPDTNTAAIQADGPIHVRGRVEVRDHDGRLLSDAPRLALCRCGLSSNKPFCDNSHVEGDFVDPGHLGRGGVFVDDMVDADGLLTITVVENGFLRLSGPVTIVGAEGEYREITKGTLCRCGASANKPFCDSTHREIGFTG